MDYKPQHTVCTADLKMAASWYMFFEEILTDNLSQQELSQGSQDFFYEKTKWWTHLVISQGQDRLPYLLSWNPKKC